jgi:hypothetical protein
MRYENLITRNLALFDLPAAKYDQIKNKGRTANYLQKIFRQLLIYDNLPDNDLKQVLREAKYALEAADPGFETIFHNDFENFINSEKHKYTWQKIKKDHNRYIRSETKRRNTDNPYYNAVPETVESWDALPDFSRQKRNQPWQFDNLYRHSQELAADIYGLSKKYAAKEKEDKDLFRAKVNGLLLPDKIIFALNSAEYAQGFGENEIIAANLKLSLDAYKLSFTFLTRAIESLHKIRWASTEQNLPDKIIKAAEDLSEKLKNRISETERRFILFMDAISESHSDNDDQN